MPINVDDMNDLEMLDIPEDLSDTESVSEDFEEVDGITPSSSSHTDDNLTTASSASNTSSEEDTISFTEPTYIELNEWLHSNEKLEFQLDERRYKHSLKKKSKSSTKYANQLYKVFEDFSSAVSSDQDPTNLNSTYDEPIGLISGDYNSYIHDREQKRQQELNNAFNKIFEIVSKNIEMEQEQESEDGSGELDNIIFEHQKLLAVLECIKSNYAYDNVSVRPELLANWINRIDPKPDIELVESVMIYTPKPYLHPQFWNTYLAQLIVRGLLGQAVNAIDKSKFSELRETSKTLYEVIEDFKTLLENYTSMSLKHQCNEWKLSCCEFRDLFPKFKEQITNEATAEADTNTSIIILSQIYDLLGIITGLPKTIASFCEEWYEVYTALSLYQVRYEDSLYKEYFELSIKEKPPQPAISATLTWDQICLNALNGNFLKVLGSIDEIDTSVGTYVARIFELKGLLSNYYEKSKSSRINSSKSSSSRTVSEYLITKYAYSCLNEHDLVPIGIGLLLSPSVFTSDQSKIDNKKTIAKFLPKFYCKTNDDLEWSLTICATLNLTSTAQSLYLKYGERSLKDGYLYEAMNMFVNSQSTSNSLLSKSEYSNLGMKQVHHIVWDLIFQDALVNNRPIKDELINNIVNRDVDSKFDIHPVIKQCLSPYAVLCEFYKALALVDDNAVDKLNKLRHLIRFNFLPKKFYPLLLSQFLPFLVNDKHQFQLPDLIVIIELIDNYDLEGEDAEEANSLYKYSIENIDSQAREYDWRVYLKSHGRELPNSVEDVIKVIRNEVVARIGRVYIDE